MLKITRGRIKQNHLVILYGPDGVGKTTFAAKAPNPVFLGAENGTASLDVARFQAPQSWSDITTTVSGLIEDQQGFKTLAIDSLDWIEPLLHAHVCKKHDVKSIEDFGYGKGYVLALQEWQYFKGLLATLREKMNIIMIAHSQVKVANDPQQMVSYDRYQLKIHEKAAALMREFVDAVLFANFETFVKGKEGAKGKAIGDGARVVYTERRPAFDAKNRFGLPFSIPLSWDEYEAAVSVDKNPGAVYLSCLNLLAQVTDETKRKQAETYLETNKLDFDKLLATQNRLNILIEAQNA